MARSPKQLGTVLAELMARRGYARVESTRQYESAWNEAVGPLVAAYTRVGSLRRGTLEVLVANSTVVQELVFQKQALLKTLDQLLPEEGIKNLRFRAGPIQ